jgi:dihydroorotate dehydrogenase (fumarate)
MSVQTTIAGIVFPHPFFNASGVHCTTQEQLENLRDSYVGGIWTKTVTLEKRYGNPHPRVFTLGNTWKQEPIISGNSVGLANNGFADMLNILKYLNATQPVVLSIGGFDTNDIINMVDIAKDAPETSISAIEINTCCPNLVGKNMLAFDFDELERVLAEIKSTGVSIPVGLKLPYYQDHSHFQHIVRIIKNTKGLVKFITCINGMSGLILDISTKIPRSRTVANHGITGIGGDIILGFALANINTFYRLLAEQKVQCDIIGCGGVRSSTEAFMMMCVGAKGVQVGTRLLMEIEEYYKINRDIVPIPLPVIHKLWETMVADLFSDLQKQNYSSIEEIIGCYEKPDNYEEIDLR